jgi:hypothetical protein
MSSISIENYIGDELADAYSVKLKDPGNTFGIRDAATLTVIVPPTAAIPPCKPGNL